MKTENFIFKMILKSTFGKIEPMQPHVENLVKQLVFSAFGWGALVGAVAMFLSFAFWYFILVVLR